jgi:hypothetical protein
MANSIVQMANGANITFRIFVEFAKLKTPQIDEFAITVLWDVMPCRDLPLPCSKYDDSMLCRESHIYQSTRRHVNQNRNLYIYLIFYVVYISDIPGYHSGVAQGYEAV